MNNFVTIDEKYADDALEWAKKHCPHYITNSYNFDYRVDHQSDWSEVIIETKYDFYFLANEQGKKEMMWFKLKWT